LIAKGERQGAIRELNKYLESFGTDTEGWLQLSELFLQEGDYTRAAFCFEELILSNVCFFIFLEFSWGCSRHVLKP